ncbi:MAG: PASTA domain-containing protein [Actinobacteria bacterium]|nr:MAG: PASTA domain-containing protein [Actinomycetota bacterium]
MQITVAGSPEAVTVPNVVGKGQNEATDQLETLEFKTAINTRSDDKVPQGVVIDQSPKANDKAPKGSVVTLTVSSGPEQVAVPSLFNVPEADAAAQLRQAGFAVERTTTADQSVAVGRVVRTDPAAGTPVAKGSTVTIVVSSGPAPTTAPPTTLPPTTTATTIPPTTVTTKPPTTSTTL